MLDFIPSRDMREIIEKKGLKFSDFDIAAIIYNTKLGMCRTHELLKELCSKTEDQELKRQIDGRLRFDNFCLERFKQNDGSFFFEATLCEDSVPWNAEDVLGHFLRVEDALARMRPLSAKFKISKFRIMREGQWQIMQDCRLTPKNHTICDRISPIRNGAPTATYFFNAQSDITWWETTELLAKEVQQAEIWDITQFDVTRFEHRFVSLPYPFSTGDIVCMTDDRSNIGVAIESKNGIKKFYKRLRKKGRSLKFNDTVVPVYYLNKDGCFSRRWDSFLMMEKADLNDIGMQKGLLMEASRLLKGGNALESFSLEFLRYQKIIKEQQHE